MVCSWRDGRRSEERYESVEQGCNGDFAAGVSPCLYPPEDDYPESVIAERAVSDLVTYQLTHKQGRWIPGKGVYEMPFPSVMN